MARSKIEEAIREAILAHASECGVDNFEISVVVTMDIEGETLNIDTDVEFESH